MCVWMLFSSGKWTRDFILESMSKDMRPADSLRAEAAYEWGFGLRKKGRGIWADFVKTIRTRRQAGQVYQNTGMRESASKVLGRGEGPDHSISGFRTNSSPRPRSGSRTPAATSSRPVRFRILRFAKEKQVVLPEFAKRTDFKTDGNTGASIDWGKTRIRGTDGPSGKKSRRTYTVRMSFVVPRCVQPAEMKIQVAERHRNGRCKDP